MTNRRAVVETAGSGEAHGRRMEPREGEPHLTPWPPLQKRGGRMEIMRDLGAIKAMKPAPMAVLVPVLVSMLIFGADFWRGGLWQGIQAENAPA